MRGGFWNIAISTVFAATSLAFADDETSLESPLEIAAGTGYAWGWADSSDSHGVLFEAALFAPGLKRGTERLAITLGHAFGDDPISRTDLTLTYLRYWRERVGAGLIGGVQHLDPRGSEANYLKPVLGLQVEGRVFHRGGFEAWLFTQYRVAQGGTGTLAFDGGSSALSARAFTLGISWRTALWD